MAEENQTLRGVNWREAFPFTQIFRAFRVAIHPTKLILALAALLCLYIGGRVLDSLWPVSNRAIPAIYGADGRIESPSEVVAFEGYLQGQSDKPFSDIREKRLRAPIEQAYQQLLLDFKVEETADRAKQAAQNASDRGQAKEKIRIRYEDDVKKAAADRDQAIKDAGNDENKKKDALKNYDQAVHRARDTRATALGVVELARNQGLFIQFFEYETQQINNVVWAVMSNNWLGGVGSNRGMTPGVFASIRNFFVVGPWWLFSQHPTYCVLFLILFSIVWAIFGGAIARIAAVHVARDEKISLGSAIKFSTSKFLSFIFAPIIPLLIVLVVGLVVLVGGLFGNIPWLGPILVGLFFFLALAAGFVMTLVLLGTGGGFNLMYPTIAVEGSDSFDAISRSFSYVYARPWRMLFYTLVALVYGALCYFFVRFFLWVMLVLTHYFVGKGVFVNVSSQVPTDLWNTMWPPQGPRGFTYSPDWGSMNLGQSAGAGLVAFWVYLTVGMLGAFAISFYFSANTIIYYLMRREVDATELDDVYLEQTEEDFTEPAPAGATPAETTPAPVTAPAGETATTPAPAPETPPATPTEPPPQA